METTEQTISQPACFKCDDLGYTAGTEVFGVARCTCPIGVTADMRAPGALTGLKLDAGRYSILTSSSVLTGSLALNAGPPEIVFGNGVLRISTSGMTYNGELIKDAGRAHRAFIATMEGRKPDEPLLQRAYDLINEARDDGQVLTIELVPLDPLAMGHYEMVADLRPKRERATIIAFGMAQEGTDCTVESVRDNETGIITITGVKCAAPPSVDDLRPLQAMMYPDRRTEARKVIWPDPSKMNFTTERRDPHSTLSIEQFDKRQEDRRKREAK